MPRGHQPLYIATKRDFASTTFAIYQFQNLQNISFPTEVEVGTCVYNLMATMTISSYNYNSGVLGFCKSKKRQQQKRVANVCRCNKETDNGGVNERFARTLVLERYSNETTKRYVLDRHSILQIVDEVHNEATSCNKNGFNMPIGHPRLPSIVKEFILPAGYPVLVSEDYLEYMLWQFPTNVTAWICRTLVTSSLLKAVGVGSWTEATPTAAAAAAAAIKWVSKDGLGAIGRLIIGGRFGGLFDDDPKQWRMYADFVGSAGSIFELATPLFPGYFIPLASLGNLTKAIARGLKDPSFRVIQNHFAASGNLGDVAAKEEVWEVIGELFGLAIGVFIIATPGLLTSYPKLALTWTSLRLLHLWLRYQSLSALRFSTINLKRARLLVEYHVSGCPIPDSRKCNQEENFLIFQELLKPRIHLGCSLQMLFGRNISGCELEALLDLYKTEKYILVVTTNHLQGPEAHVAFKVGATSITVLRSVWQTYWLYIHGELFNKKDLLNGSFLSSQDKLRKGPGNLMNHLTESLLNLNEHFDDFLFQMENAGWDVKQLALKVPTKVTIIENDI